MKIFNILCLSCALLYTGTGTIQAQELFDERTEIYSGLPDSDLGFSTRFGQLDGTGGLDLATSVLAFPIAPEIYIHLNNGSDINFNNAPAFFSESLVSFYYYALADFNGDGIDDLVTDIGYYSHSGDFNYVYQDYYDPILEILTQGDLNDDNVPDLVLRDNDNLYVGLNDGSGNFGDLLLINEDNFPINYIPEPIIADFTGDGLADIVAYPTYVNQEFFLYTQTADGNFSPQVLPLTQLELNGGFPPENRASGMSDVDYDTDGDLDILFENETGAYMLVNTGVGIFEGVDTLLSKQTPSRDQYLDLNQDGVVDLIRTTDNDDFIKIRLRDATGSTLETINIPGGSYNTLVQPVFADIDGDTDLDLIETRLDAEGHPALYLRKNTTVNEPNATRDFKNLVAHRVFPNPGSGLFNVSIEDADFLAGQLILSNNTGRMVHSQTVSAGGNQLDLTATEHSGLLYYQLFAPDGQLLATGKLIKN